MHRKGVRPGSRLNHLSEGLEFSSLKKLRSSNESNHDSILTLPHPPRRHWLNLLLLDLWLAHGFVLDVLPQRHKRDQRQQVLVLKVRGSTLKSGRISTEQLVRISIANILEAIRQLAEPGEAGGGDLD